VERLIVSAGRPADFISAAHAGQFSWKECVT